MVAAATIVAGAGVVAAATVVAAGVVAAGAGAAPAIGFAAIGAAGAVASFAAVVDGSFAPGNAAELCGRGAAGAPRPAVERKGARGAAGADDAGFGGAASGAGADPPTAPEGVGFAGGVAFSGVLIKCSRCRAKARLDKGKIEPGG
jgi:hypothetical protein